jgi:hypothetical protein
MDIRKVGELTIYEMPGGVKVMHCPTSGGEQTIIMTVERRKILLYGVALGFCLSYVPKLVAMPKRTAGEMIGSGCFLVALFLFGARAIRISRPIRGRFLDGVVQMTENGY